MTKRDIGARRFRIPTRMFSRAPGASAMLDSPMCTDEKSKVALLIRDATKASVCSLIEEWWINVHAFDLAGGALSNRVPLSRSDSLPLPSLFPIPLSLSLPPFYILCACYRHERRHVVRTAFTPLRPLSRRVYLSALRFFFTSNHRALVAANRKCVSLFFLSHPPPRPRPSFSPPISPRVAVYLFY